MKKIIIITLLIILTILSFQGVLGNLASGITISLSKPYKVGDYVEISEKFGVVESIEVLTTSLNTPGQKTLLIPNNEVTSGEIINYSTKGYIQVELEVTIPYIKDFSKIKPLIINEIKTIPEVLQNPEPKVGILKYDSHHIVLSVRPFIKPTNYLETTFDVYGAMQDAFSTHGIKVSYLEVSH